MVRWRGLALAFAVAVLLGPSGIVRAGSSVGPGEVASGEARRVELVMFEQAGCHWCQIWDEQIGGIYHKTEEGQSAPLRRVDIHKPMPGGLSSIRKASFTPTFVLVENGQEIGRIRGYPGADFFFPLLGELLKKLDSGAKLEKVER